MSETNDLHETSWKSVSKCSYSGVRTHHPVHTLTACVSTELCSNVSVEVCLWPDSGSGVALSDLSCGPLEPSMGLILSLNGKIGKKREREKGGEKREIEKGRERESI